MSDDANISVKSNISALMPAILGTRNPFYKRQHSF